MVRTTTTSRSGSPDNHESKKVTKDEGDDKSHTYSRNLLLDDVYQTI